jgi:tRNA(Arg) A34 adenosine deaminase TadA
MQLGDLFLALAFDKGGDKKAVILVLHRGKAHTVKNSAVESANFKYDTPVVNLLQNLSVDDVRNCWIYSTYVPDEMDLGMACMRGVAGIVYPTGPNKAEERRLSDQSGPGALKAYSGDNEWNLFLSSPRQAALDSPWGGKQKWQDRSWLAGWIKLLEGGKISPAAKEIWDSYDNLQGPFNGRPSADIEKLNKYFSKGLTGVDYSPCAELSMNSRDQIFMMAAFALVGCAWASEQARGPAKRTTSISGGHNIGAVMVDAGNRLIGWGLNLSALNGTFHGETAMVLAYLRRHNVDRLPDGCRIYATLKPCHMCAGFIARVAKNVTVIYGQNDPKITHSALDDGRGEGITQLASTVSIGAKTKIGAFNARGRYMTVSQALAEMINSSGLNAVPFLYSDNAKVFYEQIRGKPWALDRAVRKFESLPPAVGQLSIRQNAPGPERGLQTIPLMQGMVKQTTLSRSASALDLATGPALIPISSNPSLPVAQLNRGQVRDMGDNVTVDIANPSRNLQALDLAIGNTDVLRRMGRRPDNRMLRTMIGSLGAIELFLRKLKTEGILTFPW